MQKDYASFLTTKYLNTLSMIRTCPVSYTHLELAYGTDKAKKLFREMMQQAQIEFGFEADNIPLMIEAIPVNGESVILIVTKVEDPEELDTRFSKFSPYKKTKQDTLHFDGADNIIDIFQKLYEETQKAASQGACLLYTSRCV